MSCVVCGVAAQIQCSCNRRRSYCSVEHQQSDWCGRHGHRLLHVGTGIDSDDEKELTIATWRKGDARVAFWTDPVTDVSHYRFLLPAAVVILVPVEFTTPINVDQLRTIYDELAGGIRGKTLDLESGGSGSSFDQMLDDLKWTVVLNTPSALQPIINAGEVQAYVAASANAVIKPHIHRLGAQSTEIEITRQLDNLPLVSTTRILHRATNIGREWFFGSSAPFNDFTAKDALDGDHVVDLIIMHREPASFAQVETASGDDARRMRLATAAQILCEHLLIYAQVVYFHNSDLHSGNVMFGEPMDADYLLYRLQSGRSYAIPLAPTQRRRVVLIDFGVAELHYRSRRGALIKLYTNQPHDGQSTPTMWLKFVQTYLRGEDYWSAWYGRLLKANTLQQQAELLLEHILAELAAPVRPPTDAKVMRIEF